MNYYKLLSLEQTNITLWDQNYNHSHRVMRPQPGKNN